MKSLKHLKFFTQARLMKVTKINSMEDTFHTNGEALFASGTLHLKLYNELSNNMRDVKY